MNQADLEKIAAKLPLSEATRKRNSSLPGAVAQSLATDPVAITPSKRIRQSTKPLLNKLEQQFLDEVLTDIPVRAQATRFKLGNGIWYKPDFVCLKSLEAWEVKGPHAFRGGFENLKVAAALYPEFRWLLVWKENDQWREQVVLP